MNAFLSTLESNNISDVEACLKKTDLTTLQVNMGNLCNQRCRHCHIDASPSGKKIMSKQTIEGILRFLKKNKGLILDITGGAPELNTYFDYFIVNARPLVDKIIVRSNLTVFFEPGKEYLPEFFKKYNIHLICSLPCYSERDVDLQRGKGVFSKSITALRTLNKLGYADKKHLTLDLVYNPVGAHLPPEQDKLEKTYRHYLKDNYGVNFNGLLTITNVPIKRFKQHLDVRGEYSAYLKLLRDNFNPDTVNSIMCRRYLSVGYDGKLYDCDFNQSLGWAIKDKTGAALTIDNLNLKDLENREITVGEHCLSCTAGYGSSCQGTLSEDSCATEIVKHYYGKVLKGTKDLKTSACCSVDAVGPVFKDILANIHPEIINKFYGCGSPIPQALKGCKVLDLGCGTGKDVYICSFLVGSKGTVIGVDMTDEQLEVAKRHIDYHTKKFGYTRPNVEFKKGYIENLKDIGIADNSIDVVISNCVINLSSDKRKVFSEIFRVLKPGGELYFSDVFTGRRMPEHLIHDPVLYGECLGGALYIEDFRRILRDTCCLDYRVISNAKISIDDREIQKKVGSVNFYSMTIRTFKLNDLEDICEDYGQVAVYLGNMDENPGQFTLDDHHIFIAKKPMLVCGNTASMLTHTRYAPYFSVTGNRKTHFGPFNCAPMSAKTAEKDENTGGACC